VSERGLIRSGWYDTLEDEEPLMGNKLAALINLAKRMPESAWIGP
jgi:hypothetical protein